MKKIICLILAIMFILMFVIQASMVAFAAAPPTENASVFAGPYTCPPAPMDEYSFSDPAIYEAIRLDLVTNNVEGVTLRSDSIPTLITDEVEILQIGELDGAAITENDIKSIVAYFPNLKVLKLENCYITSIPAEIENLASLSELYLSGNTLIGLSNIDFSKLTSLSILELNSCGLTDISTLFNISTLHVLKLSNNNLTSEMIPQNIYMPNLEELDLSYNALTTIPSSFSQLQALKYLILNNNKITSVPSMYLQELIACNIENNELSSPCDSLARLRNPLLRNNNIFADILSIIRRYSFPPK